MTALALTPTQRKAHRAAAHHLDAVVWIGDQGLTPAVQAEVDKALAAHGLVKVNAASDDREARAAMLAGLAEALSAAPVQHIGKQLVLWRPPAAKEKSEAELAKRGRGVKEVKVVKFAKSGSHRPQVKRIKVLGNERLTPGGQVKRAKSRRPTSLKKAAQG